MSSAVVYTSAALGRPFVLDPNPVAEVSPPAEPASGRSQSHSPQRADRVDRPGLSCEFASADPRLARVTPASRLGIRPVQRMSAG
jgi:hypothetical protein